MTSLCPDSKAHWKLRWFVIWPGGVLVYYDSEAHATMGLSPRRPPFHLEGASVRRPKSARRTQEHTFRIDCLSSKKLILAAETADEAQRWITALVASGVQALDVTPRTVPATPMDGDGSRWSEPSRASCLQSSDRSFF